MKRFIFLPLLILFVTASSLFAQKAIKNVAVIAPTTHDYELARDIMTKSSWTKVPFKDADAVLVVMNNSLSNPLSKHYQKFISLKLEAETNPRVVSQHWHVYIYDIQPDSSLSERSHNVSAGSF